ncbi:alpha/beta fold hydrolase [Actinomadura sp. 7K507]|uniref:alpha/beta fold hydrolase n=1 Tax=Actinomadura sp. 7K507 TaxID=2530365 RepID=UPI001045EEEE|nr:alpha/beta fold hydrolase [Actinomadura sp. 7K507]TDC97073.1 alpha/beta fold hydrolase [Actinomadura sp. 7K507]
MRQADWGVLSPRWAGIRSQEIDVCGTSVHYLSTDAGQAGPTHLLIHPMAGSASMLLDLIAPLRTLGPVVAPDLPGTLFGHTVSPHPRAAKAAPNARFLRAFAARLGVQDAVVHGWSMGALVAVLFAGSAPERVGRVVLAAPALPGPLPADEVLFWRTAGRLGLAIGPPAARAVLRLTGRRLLDLKLKMVTESGDRPGGTSAGGDLSWLSPEMTALLSAEVRSAQPQRLGDAVTAFASVISALFIDQRPIHQAIADMSAPALLLWGDQDPLIPQSTIDELARRRPDWERCVFATAGHLLPLEASGGYVTAVGQWLAAAEDSP